MQVQHVEDIQQELERYRRDALFFDEHREELLRQYPEQWVAIYRQQAVGADKSLEDLVRQLERQGVPRGRAFLDYVTEQEDLLIV